MCGRARLVRVKEVESIHSKGKGAIGVNREDSLCGCIAACIESRMQIMYWWIVVKKEIFFASANIGEISCAYTSWLSSHLRPWSWERFFLLCDEHQQGWR